MVNICLIYIDNNVNNIRIVMKNGNKDLDTNQTRKVYIIYK